MYGQPTYYPNPAAQMAQQRLQTMEVQYPQFGNQQPNQYPQMNGYMPQGMQPQTPGIIKGRPVANAEEANAAMIDFDGSLFLFPDKNNGKIYSKQLGLDGNIIFNSYSLDQGNRPAPPAKNDLSGQAFDVDLSSYVKKEELEKALSGPMEVIASLEQKLKELGNLPGNNGKGGNK